MSELPTHVEPQAPATEPALADEPETESRPGPGPELSGTGDDESKEENKDIEPELPAHIKPRSPLHVPPSSPANEVESPLQVTGDDESKKVNKNIEMVELRAGANVDAKTQDPASASPSASASAPSGESPTTGDDGALTEEEKKKEKEQQSILEKKRTITSIISTVVMTSCILVIIFELLTIKKFHDDESKRKVGIMYAAAITGIIISPTVMVKQYILQRLDTLRCVHNKIRQEVNRLTEENNVLHRSVDELEVEVQRLQGTEETLSSIIDLSKDNVDVLLKAVREKREIVKRQGEIARRAFQESLLTTVLRTDHDQDLQITDREVDHLIVRMRRQKGITFDEDLFRKKIEENNGDIWVIMDMLSDAMDKCSGKSDDNGGEGSEDCDQKLLTVHEKPFIESLTAF